MDKLSQAIASRISAAAVIALTLSSQAAHQSYFNYNDAHFYTDPYRGVLRPGDNLEEVLIASVQRAQGSIDVAIHEFRLPLLASALADRARSGVQVRVILENDYNFSLREIDWDNVRDDYTRRRLEEYIRLVDIDRDGRLENWEFDQRDAIQILRKAGIPIIDDREDGSRGSDLMHSKFMVIDNRDVVTGSANYTPSDVHGDLSDLDTRGNANNVVAFWDEPALAAEFAQEFAIMWGDGPGKLKDSRFGPRKPYRAAKRIALSGGDFANVQFSPTSQSMDYSYSVGGLIERTLGLATKSVDIAQFVFSDQRLSNKLGEKYLFDGQMSVRTLIENRFAFQWYSELLDMLGVEMYSDKCQLQEGNSPWGRPVLDGGTPGLVHGDMLHHKFAVIDGYYTVFGSHNWTASANEANDEATIVLESFQTGREFGQEFERQLSRGTFGLPPAVQKKIEELRRRCTGKALPAFIDFDI